MDMRGNTVSLLGHLALRGAVARGHSAFLSACSNIEHAQRARLSGLLRRIAAVDGRVDSRWNWEAFRRQMPVTDWQAWGSLVERQRKSGERLLINSDVMRYQPTSGSTSAIKWVPYTQQFLGELDAAIAPWLADLYRQYPGVRRGHHYWSLSWLPMEMRDISAITSGQKNHDLNDDMSMLSVGKRALTSLMQAVPQNVSLASTSDDSLFMTLAFLVADAQLSAISVWSPTFAINLLERMRDWREPLADVLARGKWGDYGERAGQVACPRSLRAADLLRAWNGDMTPGFFQALWPQLALVSAWDTAAATPWATQLRATLPHAGFQGKGLWATEGVVTIPVRGAHVLACNSHVYEFENMDDQQVLAPWELRIGQRVRPLLSTGSGLLRYRMSDVLEVDGFLHAAPTLRFLGRDDGTDLVGEKLGAVFVQSVLDSLPVESGCAPVTVLALDNAGDGKPGYSLLLEDSVGAFAADKAGQASLAACIEERFCRHFHYQLARNLGQLDAVRVLCAADLRRVYTDQCQRRGMIAGNVKIEPLRHWRGELPAELASIIFRSQAGHANHTVVHAVDRIGERIFA